FLMWKRVGSGSSLVAPKKPLTAFRIDWATIDRRRKVYLQKLDMMQQYAYTKGCRRGLVMRYFGDPAARAKCSGCDNCMGTKVIVEAGTAPSQRGGARAARGATRRSADRSGEASVADDFPTLSGADEALLARLRDLRRTI